MKTILPAMIIVLFGIGLAQAAPQPPTHYGKQAFPTRIYKHAPNRSSKAS
jgi:hypothetical protein